MRTDIAFAVGVVALLGDRVSEGARVFLLAVAIVPLFALANAGVDLGDGALGDALGSRLTWAIVAGLVIGKLAGIGGATRLGPRWGSLPEGMPRAQLAGLAVAARIGFTVSLFIAELAFEDPALVDRAKVGVFAGSLVSGVLGAARLTLVSPRRRV